jgi:hypothetical protein
MRYVIGISIGLCASGCASWFMNGGKLVEDDYQPTVKAEYTVPGCKSLADGSAIAGPADTTYKLVQDGDGLGMFEQSADGTGAVINNHWKDDKGDHFFGWVQSSGWEYIVPSDADKPATRVVYTGLETREDGNVTKPTSAPVATCEMIAR